MFEKILLATTLTFLLNMLASLGMPSQKALQINQLPDSQTPAVTKVATISNLLQN